jgi:uncharacterized membrane protein YcaP (DUF421 family)
MDTIFRALAIYLFLMVVFTLAGKRSLAEIDTFDLVLVLIISECTQQALIGSDYSVLTAFISISTLVGAEVFFGCLRQRWPVIEKATTGGPLVIFKDGHFYQEKINREKIGEEDVLQAARHLHGLENLDQIRYAILEASGEISIIPKAH